MTSGPGQPLHEHIERAELADHDRVDAGVKGRCTASRRVRHPLATQTLAVPSPLGPMALIVRTYGTSPEVERSSTLC